MIWNEVICLGDSLTYGARDEFGRSYTAEIPYFLEKNTKEHWICHNYGINGETSSDLLRRAWNNITAHESAKIVCALIGTNDTKIPIPVEIYRDNIEQITKICLINQKFLILGTLPIIKINSYYRNNLDYVDKYNKVLREVAKKFKTELCDLGNLEEHLIDGVHFGNAGYKAIAKLWTKSILKQQK